MFSLIKEKNVNLKNFVTIAAVFGFLINNADTKMNKISSDKEHFLS